MNEIHIIGNLTADPTTRTVNLGGQQVNVCSFSVAVNTRKKGADGRPVAVFYNVSAWRGLGDNCQKYTSKGRKVYVCGEPSVRYYTGRDGTIHTSIEITADQVEFLSSRNDGQQAPAQAQAPVDAQTGYTQAQADNDLPF